MSDLQRGPDARMLELISRWDGKGVVIRYDEPTSTWIFVALHDDTLGRPLGGCRMKVYDHPADGLEDALRLAAGMTSKWAVIDLPYGGGKSVLAIPRPMEGAERRGLLARFGELLESLKGAYATGEDLGTTPEDMGFLATVTQWVKCGPPDSEDGPQDPGPYTALGVFESMREAWRVLDGGVLEGRSVLVQGVGDVGAPLVRLLADAGARLLLSDVRTDVVSALAAEVGAALVEPAAVHATECDVYAPCALGATLNAHTIPQLRCRLVAGSANNQLATDADAGRLLDRGITYVPDYVINAGGALAFGLMQDGLTDESELHARVRGLGDITREILEEGRRLGESPVMAANRRVQRVMERGPLGEVASGRS